jgi:hypothetical protein
VPDATVKAPTLGRIVFVGNVAGKRAAIVCRVWNESYINAAVFTEDGAVVPRTSIAHEAKRQTPSDECWSWPTFAEG